MSSKRPGSGLLSTLSRPLAAVGRLIGGGAKPAETPSEAEGDEREERAGSLVDDAFTLALQTMLTEDDGQFQTKLQLISLVEFREAVGSKWPRVRDKVMLIAEGVINLHLGAGNTFGRQGEDFFVLVFRSVPTTEARRRAVAIAQALGTRLLGDQFIGLERPLALAAEISLADALNPDGSLNLDALHDAIGEMRCVIAEQAEGDKTKVADSGWTAMEGPGSKPAEPNWQAMTLKTGGTQSADGTTPPMPGDAQLSLLWRPSWVAAGEVIGAYKAQVSRLDGPGQQPYEGCAAYPVDGGETALNLDHFAIGAAIRGIRAAEQAGDRPLAILPLHWASASSAKRLSLLAPLANLPEQTRATRLVIDLFGCPPDCGNAELAATIAALRPLCREVILRVGLAHPRLGQAAATGLKTIGIDLAELPPAERTDDTGLLVALERLRRQASDLGLGTYVWGIRRRAVIMGTVNGGFAMINGPGLMKDLARPAKVLPAPRSRFGNA